MPKKTISQTTFYPVVIHREGNTFGYFSPEFGGGGAPTFQDAIRLAQEMMSAAAEMTEAGQNIPEPSDFSALEAEGGQIISLPVTITNTAERIYITLPKTLLAQIDAATPNRSAFFAELARERLEA